MMEVKVLEIRDSLTYLGALAIKMTSSDPIQSRHLWRAGYEPGSPCIVMVRLNDAQGACDPYMWPERSGGTRTMAHAHLYVVEHWDELRDGDVIDIEHIYWQELGLAAQPAKKEPDGPHNFPGGAY